MSKRTVQTIAYLGAVVAVVMLIHEASAIQINPIFVVGALLGIPVVVVALIRFPAVFIVPVLFVPRAKEIPVISRFDDEGFFTILAICLALAAVAVLIRLAKLRARGESILDLFRAQVGPVAAYLSFATVVAISFAY